MTVPASSHDPSLRELSQRVARRWRPMLVVAVLIFSAVAAWTFTAAPRYLSAALLRIDNRSGGGGMLSRTAARAAHSSRTASAPARAGADRAAGRVDGASGPDIGQGRGQELGWGGHIDARLKIQIGRAHV